MVMEPQEDPKSALLAFFEKLPLTIKKDVVAPILVYAFRDMDIDGSTDVVARLEQSLNQKSAEQTIGAILGTIVATDYVLDNFTLNKTKHLRRLSQLAQNWPQLEIVLRGAPLRQRHFERARRDFDVLKRDALSFHMLQDFENNLRKKQIGL
jgi:hypothetical protein